MSKTSYASSINCGQQFEDQLTELIEQNSLKDICDIGGGANPIFDREFHRRNGLNYSLLDISQKELDKAPDYYHKVCADILDPSQMPKEKWDLVFSQTLAEHVEDGKKFHESVYRSLKPGGYAMHIFPTMYAIPFVVNKFLPEKLGSKILDLLLPRDRFQHDKFPAFYHWCEGPTNRMISRLESIGYEVTNYQGLFGHRYYRFLKPLQWWQDKYANWLVKHPNPFHTSYVIQILRKPEQKLDSEFGKSNG